MSSDPPAEEPPRPEGRHQGAQAKLFIGVPISVGATDGLGEVANAMRRKAYDNGYQIRWVPPVNYHVTLAFLGNTSVDTIAIIRDRLAPALAPLSRFDFEIRGFGGFPKLERARVLWAGIPDRSGHLAALAGICTRELADLGFRPDRREYHPHVTIGRVKQPDDLRTVIQQHAERVFSKTWVDFVVLFESVAKSGGYHYIERARLGLGKRSENTKRQSSTVQPSTPNAESQAPSGDRPPTSGVTSSPDA